MCGIVGAIGNYDRRFNRIGLDGILHRGPDNNGIYEEKNLFLGHTRLSIIDIEGGRQPMMFSGHILVYNGELYNFNDLRNRLELKGIKFETNSDTEVILKAYLTYGISAFSLFDGMFALAIYNTKTKRLLVARDPLGQKPLYWFMDDEKFLFSSDIRSLKEYANGIDQEAVKLLLNLSYIPAPFAIYSNISKVNPGEIIEIDFDQSKGIRHKKSVFRFDMVTKRKLSNHWERVLVSDVPVALSLSGGIDSSLVLAIDRCYSNSISATFTLNSKFNEKSLQRESLIANRFASRHKTIHTQVELDASAINEYFAVFSEPFGDSSAFAVHNIALGVKGRYKVLMGGEAADELFAGYRKHLALRFFILTKRLGVNKILSRIVGGKFEQLMSSDNTLDGYLSLLEMGLEENEVRSLINSPKYSLKDVLNKRIPLTKKNEKFKFSDSLYLDRRIVLEGDMFVKTDRVLMHHGIEGRTPFGTPWVERYAQNKRFFLALMPFLRKPFLKFLSIFFLPSYILFKRKTGFEIPIVSLVEQLLSKKNYLKIISESELGELLNTEAIASLLNTFESNKTKTNARKIWIIISLIEWDTKYGFN